MAVRLARIIKCSGKGYWYKEQIGATIVLTGCKIVDDGLHFRPWTEGDVNEKPENICYRTESGALVQASDVEIVECA